MKKLEKLKKRRIQRTWHLKKIRYAEAFMSELENDIKKTYPQDKILMQQITKLRVSFNRIQTRLKNGLF